MWTLVAGYQSMTNGVVYQPVNGVLDQSMTLDSSNRFAIPGPWQLFAAAVVGINLQNARINAPSLRSFILPEIYPTIPAAAIPSGKGPIILGKNGPRFASQEYAIVEISRAGADAQPVTWGMWIGPDITPAAAGQPFCAVATATITLVAGSWVLGSLAFNQTLPAGRYQVVGMGVTAATSAFARLVFPGLSQYRPGVMVQVAYGDFPWTDDFHYGKMGSMGEFVHNAPPSIEVLGLSAGATAITAFLELVKIG